MGGGRPGRRACSGTARSTRSTRWSATAARATRASAPRRRGPTTSLNWPAARLAARADRGARRRPVRWRAWRRDAGAHPVPNAGRDRGGVRRRARAPAGRHARLRRARRAPADARRRPRADPGRRAPGDRASRAASSPRSPPPWRSLAEVPMKGALLVAGTASDAGKSVGHRRALPLAAAARASRVAPFKAQNMALNSTVTRSGAEIGRAQAMQAAACGIEPEAAMNPVLIKPSGPAAQPGARDGQAVRERHRALLSGPQGELQEPVHAALADLRARFDVVVCEGAGRPAEINLRARRPGQHGPRAGGGPAGAAGRRHRPRRRLPVALRHARAARARGPGARSPAS